MLVKNIYYTDARNCVILENYQMDSLIQESRNLQSNTSENPLLNLSRLAYRDLLSSSITKKRAVTNLKNCSTKNDEHLQIPKAGQ